MNQAVLRYSDIVIKCQKDGCAWPGHAEIQLGVKAAEKIAKEHVWHTGHRVMVMVRQWYEVEE